MSSSFEWLELETLSRDIAILEDRLRAARSTKNHGLMRLLEQQLDQATRRRPIILEAITRHAAESAASPASKPSKQKKPVAVLVEDAPAVAAPEPSAEDAAQPCEGGAAVAVQAIAEPEDEPETQAGEGDDASSVVVPFAASVEPFPVSTEGTSTVWNQLTPDHLENAKRELGRRREEILSRHAEELKALETERDELEALDLAIGVFTRKFSSVAASNQVVPIEEGQRMRM
jgi:hypothetical protein